MNLLVRVEPSPELRLCIWHMEVPDTCIYILRYRGNQEEVYTRHTSVGNSNKDK